MDRMKWSYIPLVWKYDNVAFNITIKSVVLIAKKRLFAVLWNGPILPKDVGALQFYFEIT